MSEFQRLTTELKSEQHSMKSAFDSLAGEIEHLRERFFEIERRCFAADDRRCVKLHDRYRLEIAQVQRQGDREKTLCFEECSHLIPSEMLPPDIYDWEVKTAAEY